MAMAIQFVALIIKTSFIDGTVAGTNINIADQYIYHDHTYYGNGCDKAYGSGGSGGSTTACSIQFINSLDETQKIGTYYNYQASTNGTGSSYPAGVTIVSDSFCPLGWQLPYGGTGGDYYDKSRSIINLLNTYDLEYVSHPPSTDILFSYPISLIESGFYHWYYGKLYNADLVGFLWTNTNGNSTGNASRFDFSLNYPSSAYLNIADVGKEGGEALRCVSSSTARWQERLQI